jgi:Ca2+/Na+ antiporter
MAINLFEPRVLAAILLMLSAGGLYLACRGAVRAAVGLHGTSAGRRALCQWLPVAATSVAAIVTRHPTVAVAVIFGTSVAYLSLVLGMATYVAPMSSEGARPRVWAFVLAPVLVALLAGLGGVLSGLHAGMLLILGAAIFAVWRQDAAIGTISASSGADHATAPKLDGARWAQLIVAIALAGVAGWAAVGGTALAAQEATLPSESLVALSVLSPMLVLPALRACVTAAEQGDAQGAVSSVVGTVLLNLCVLLPIVILLWYPVSGTPLKALLALQPAADLSRPAQGLIYPNGIWRLETIMLLVLGFGLIPVALGRVTLARVESAILIGGYAMYLLAVTWSARGM